MTNKTDKMPVNETNETDETNETHETNAINRTGSIRRIMAWVMLFCFVLLVINILFLHKMIAETAILYMALVAVFFLGNGARGGAKRYVGQEQGESGAEREPEQGEPGAEREPEQGESGVEFESDEEIESGKEFGSDAIGMEKPRKTGGGKPG